MTHQCPGPRCDVEVDSSELMCPAHWHQVPKPVRRAVWITWNRGKGVGTLAHFAAIRAAIAAVNRDVVPASSLKHPARSVTFHGSAAGRGLVSPQEPGGSPR
jgi:hypothetical protein